MMVHKVSGTRQALAFVIMSVFVVAVMLLIGALTPSAAAAGAGSFHFVQDLDPDLVMVDFSRLSWGAIIAGSLIAIMIQLSFNLLGIAVGAAGK
jgi:hypothetical protein